MRKDVLKNLKLTGFIESKKDIWGQWSPTWRTCVNGWQNRGLSKGRNVAKVSYKWLEIGESHDRPLPDRRRNLMRKIVHFRCLTKWTKMDTRSWNEISFPTNKIPLCIKLAQSTDFPNALRRPFAFSIVWFEIKSVEEICPLLVLNSN